MGIMKRYITTILISLFAVSACNSFLEPLPDGSYNDENFDSFASLKRGYIDKAYNLLPDALYYQEEFIGMDAMADDAIYRDLSHRMHLLSTGRAQMTSYAGSSWWSRDYEAINYLNKFLKDDMGYKSRYLVDNNADAFLVEALQGDAYGLRAYYYYDLLKKFGGRGTDGKMLGVPIFLEPSDLVNETNDDVVRASYDETVERIIEDCDSALVHLPVANRNFMNPEGAPTNILGGVRYRLLDQMAIHGIKAYTYLIWASPAFNPEGDKSRYRKAAEEAYKVIEYKLTYETKVSGGFNPAARFLWTEPNTPEAVWISQASNTDSYERNFYPGGFNGSAGVNPTQDLVDAFPMANGYPIDHPKSGYDPAHPYEGRDPRFYCNIFYNGSSIGRYGSAVDKMYTFDTTVGGKDAAGGTLTSNTNYYLRKFIYSGWNGFDESLDKASWARHNVSWTLMCLVFAEAANHFAGPLDASLGLSAKDAIAYLRNRPANDNKPGIGASGQDPFLDECAVSGEEEFDRLVRNEWRIATCFQGIRFYNLRRWAKSVDEVNVPVHMVRITKDGDQLIYEYPEVAQRSFPSLYLPLPYLEVRKCNNLVQNEGWSSWK